MRLAVLLAFMFVAPAALAPAALAQEPLAKVYACADITDGAKRLECYDTAVAGLKKDVAGGDVAVVTKQQIKEAEVKAFGSNKPASVTTAVAAAQGKKVDAPDTMSFKVTNIIEARDGKLHFVMDNGQVWRQTEADKINGLGKGPWTAEVKKGPMGNYMLKLDGKTAVRVKRADTE
jgi:hypothetical protein